MKSKWVSKVLTVHPEGNMNFGSKCHAGNPGRSRRDILLKSKNVIRTLVLSEMSGDQQSYKIHFITSNIESASDIES